MLPDHDPPGDSGVIRRFVVQGMVRSAIEQEFQRLRISVNAQGMRLLEVLHWIHTPSPLVVTTVEVTPRQLGFPEGAITQQIFDAAEERGLKLCPLEWAPEFRLQLLEQPTGRWITIAAPRLNTPPDLASGFYLRRLDDGLWLRGYTASDDWVFDADDSFLFWQQETEDSQQFDEGTNSTPEN